MLLIKIYVCTYTWNIFSDILPAISSDILSDISSDILSGISFDILSDILSDILADKSPRMIAIEVRRGTLNSQDRGWGLNSQDRGWGPVRDIELTPSRLRSGAEHWTHRIAVEVRHGTLNSHDRGWGSTQDIDEEEDQEKEKEKEEEGRAHIKSNNHHLTGGELDSACSVSSWPLGLWIADQMKICMVRWPHTKKETQSNKKTTKTSTASRLARRFPSKTRVDRETSTESCGNTAWAQRT